MKLYDGNGNEVTLDETLRIPYQNLPKVYITCEDATTSMAVLADNKKHPIEIKYIDGEKKFSCYGTAKKQGNFTSAGNKKNLNITLYTDNTLTKKKKICFGSWYEMSKYHIKGNRSDYSMVRNSVMTRIAYQFCGGTNLPNGAWGFVDSFPIILYWNDTWFGCYTWNLPQDEHLFNFKDGNENHMAWRIETPGSWTSTSGWEFRGDEDNLTENMTASFQSLLDIMSSESVTKAQVESNFDVNSLLAYILFLQIGHCNDNTLNNWTVATWDGEKWYHILYDLDIGFGFSNAGTIPYSSLPNLNDFHSQVVTLFADEMKTVYANMRNAGLTPELISNSLYAYQRRWGWENLQAEYAKWESDKPFKVGLDVVLTWETGRIAYLDTLYEYSAS